MNRRSTKEAIKIMERNGKTLLLIRKAEDKRVSKRKIIQFLKKKGIRESIILDAYRQYYSDEKLYEITFTQRPLGFSIIMDTRGKNALVAAIQDPNNIKLGMKMASRIYEVNGKRVDDMRHKEILKIISSCQCPFYIVFKESAKDTTRLDKLQKKLSDVWIEPADGSESEKSETESSEESSYSSDDDVRHVQQHFKRKQKTNDSSQSPNENKSINNQDNKRKSHPKGIFKKDELEMWDEEELDNEKSEMYKELAKLMVTAAVANVVPTEDSTLQAMSEARKATLNKLVDSAPKDNTTSAELSELRKDDDDTPYDPEILRYLQDLMGSAEKRSSNSITPSMSLIMNNMWAQEDLIRKEHNHDVGANHNHTNSANTDHQNLSSDEKKENNDALSQMKEGTTLLKYGRYGSGGYRTFQLSKDHKYLIWYSQKKDVADTRIPVIEIREIKIGKESDIVRRTKEEEIYETSFTIVYGKDEKQLTVTAKSPKEAYVWAQGLKILSDAAKKGTNISNLKSLGVEKENIPNHEHSKSVVISMDHVKNHSVLGIFHKNNEADTIEKLIKRHSQLKTQLQKCVDFVMEKKNYKIIKEKGDFASVKGKLEQIDSRLRKIKTVLSSEDNIKDISKCKAELYSSAADLDAFKQMLTVLVRQPKEL